MKRLTTFLITFAIMFTLASVAHADVVWEPDNRFYEQHSAECTYVGRTYYANGHDGFVTLWDAPNGSAVTAQYENGFELLVYWQYKDWGCITVWGDEGNIDGWVSMQDLYLVYDHISFEEEYGEHFKDYDGEFSNYTGTGEGIQIWEYPYDAAPKYVWESANADMTAALTGPDNYISKVFKDHNGDRWGYVNYLFGERNFWINMDNPTGDGVMSSCIPKVDDLIASGKLIAPQTPTMPAASLTPGFLVGGVVLITLVLLRWFYKRKVKDI